MSDEREDLEHLLNHPGWLRVGQFAHQEFAGQMLGHVEAAANAEDAQALSHLRQIIAGKRAVEKLMAWPAERLRQLNDQRQQAATVSLGRGGRR